MTTLQDVVAHIKDADIRIVIRNGRIVEVSGTLTLDEFKIPLAAMIGAANCISLRVFDCRDGVCTAEVRYMGC